MEPCHHDSLQLRQLQLRWAAGIRGEMWLFFWAALAPLMVHEASINTCWLIACAEDTLFLRCSPFRGIRAALSSSYDVVPPMKVLALLLCSVRMCAHILVMVCGWCVRPFACPLLLAPCISLCYRYRYRSVYESIRYSRDLSLPPRASAER
eukprot:scaffold2620_cov125-Isochrysis_galbana.AAC.2